MPSREVYRVSTNHKATLSITVRLGLTLEVVVCRMQGRGSKVLQIVGSQWV